MSRNKQQQQTKETPKVGPGPVLFWVISGKNAYQSYLMVLLLVSSITLMLNPEANGYEWITRAWGGIIFASAFFSLLGVYWRGSLLVGLRMELVACVTLGVSSVLIGILTLILSHSINSGLILVFALAVAAAARFWQIISAFKQVLSFKKEIASITDQD